MKKQTVSFQFDTTPAPFRPLCPTDAAAGVLLLAGIWGLLWQCRARNRCRACWGWALWRRWALLRDCCCGGIGNGSGLPSAERCWCCWRRAYCCGATSALLWRDWETCGASGAFSRPAVHAALCGGGQRLVDAAACGGCNGPCCGSCAAAALADMAGGRLRSRTAGAASGGPCAGGWWFTCFLLGVLLCFVQGSAIGRRAKAVTAGALALVLLIGLLPEGLSGGASPTALGRRLGKALHRWRYEDARRSPAGGRHLRLRSLFPRTGAGAAADHGSLDAPVSAGLCGGGVHRHRLAAAGRPGA